MSKLEQIKLKLAAMLSAAVKFSTIKTDKAVIEWNGVEDLKAGDEVFVTNENGERVAVADGEYVTEDGKVITVATKALTKAACLSRTQFPQVLDGNNHYSLAGLL